jgi:hypothetical protein
MIVTAALAGSCLRAQVSSVFTVVSRSGSELSLEFYDKGNGALEVLNLNREQPKTLLTAAKQPVKLASGCTYQMTLKPPPAGAKGFDRMLKFTDGPAPGGLTMFSVTSSLEATRGLERFSERHQAPAGVAALAGPDQARRRYPRA